jgi:hypothetical protein
VKKKAKNLGKLYFHLRIFRYGLWWDRVVGIHKVKNAGNNGSAS